MSYDTPVPHPPGFPEASGLVNASGQPLSRDGSMSRDGKSRQVKRNEEREAINAQDKARKAFNSPASKGEVQHIAMQFFAALEKMGGEFRKLSIRHEAAQRLLLTKGVVTKEEFEAEARMQLEWNQVLDGLLIALNEKQVPLPEIIAQARNFNAVPENRIKIEWTHLDLAPRLLQDEGMTLEDKLLMATELEMPEKFIEQLRAYEEKRYATPVTPPAEPSEPSGPSVASAEAHGLTTILQSPPPSPSE